MPEMITSWARLGIALVLVAVAHGQTPCPGFGTTGGKMSATLACTASHASQACAVLHCTGAQSSVDSTEQLTHLLSELNCRSARAGWASGGAGYVDYNSGESLTLCCPIAVPSWPPLSNRGISLDARAAGQSQCRHAPAAVTTLSTAWGVQGASWCRARSTAPALPS